MHPLVLIRLCKKRSIRHMARLRLYLPLFLSCVFILLAFLGTSFIFWSLVSFVDSYALRLVLSMGGVCLLSLLLLAPFLCGVRALLLHDLLFGERGLSLLFYFFTHKKRYFYALKRGFYALLRTVLCGGALLGVLVVGNRVIMRLLDIERYAGAMLFALMCLLLLFLIFRAAARWRRDSFLLDAAFLSAPLLSYRQLRALSVRRMQGRAYLLRRFRLSFLPLWILSFLLLGIPLILILPYYLGARATLAASLLRA